MIHLATAAMIAPDVTVRAAVGNVKFATAVTIAKEPCKKRLTAADRATTHEALPIGAIGDQALTPLELRPCNVALMVVLDQNLPGAALPAEAPHDSLAAGLDRHPTARTPEGVGASIDRIGQDVADRVGNFHST